MTTGPITAIHDSPSPPAGAASRRPALPAGLTFRAAVPGDTAFLRMLYRTTREPELAHAPWSEQQKAAFCDMQFMAQTHSFDITYPDAERLVIRVGDFSAGRLIKSAADGLTLVDIALLPEFRNRGLGTAILRLLQDEADAMAAPLRLSVVKSNRALALYRRLGFAVTGEGTFHYSMQWPAPASRQNG